MKKSTMVGMIERLKKLATSFVLSLEPMSPLRRSKKSFERLRNTRKKSTASRIKLRLMIPKKKIEFTKGSVLDSFASLSATLASTTMASKTPTIVSCSRLRLRRSGLSSGVKFEVGTAQYLTLEAPQAQVDIMTPSAL